MSISKEELDQKRTELNRLQAEYQAARAEERRVEREKQYEIERKEKEEMKDRLAKSHGIPRDKKFEKAWDIAWERGHSGGYEEVENYFDELVELIKP